MEVGATHQESFQINVDENDDDGAVKCILESPKVLRGKSKQPMRKGSLPPPKRMNFWKSSEEGREIIFNPKIYIAKFGPLNRAI